MTKFYDVNACRRKADQHWEMAGLAHQDGDKTDAAHHTREAALWEFRITMGGWHEKPAKKS